MTAYANYDYFNRLHIGSLIDQAGTLWTSLNNLLLLPNTGLQIDKYPAGGLSRVTVRSIGTGNPILGPYNSCIWKPWTQGQAQVFYLGGHQVSNGDFTLRYSVDDMRTDNALGGNGAGAVVFDGATYTQGCHAAGSLDNGAIAGGIDKASKTLYFRRTTDFATWSDPVAIGSLAGSAQPNHCQVWQRTDLSIITIYATNGLDKLWRSEDYGRTWTALTAPWVAEIATWRAIPTNDGDMYGWLSGTVDGNGGLVATALSPAGSGFVGHTYFKRSTDGGQTWGAAVEVAAGSGFRYPCLVHQPAGVRPDGSAELRAWRWSTLTSASSIWRSTDWGRSWAAWD